MIKFNIEHTEIYNDIINSLLRVEVFESGEDIGDCVENMYPNYLYREQFKKCEEVLRDLYNWTGDEFLHDLSCFHELALIYFLKSIENYSEEDLKAFFINDELQLKIISATKEEHLLDPECSIRDYEENFYNIYLYPEILMLDLDIIFIDEIYNAYKIGNEALLKHLGIDIDEFYDILPVDIQKQYHNNSITLEKEIKDLLNYIQEKMNYGSMAKLFWKDNKSISEKDIQLLLSNIFDAYFYKLETNIFREHIVGNGQIDFEFYRNKQEKIIVEVKKANNNLELGYNCQLVDYMKSGKYKKAFYLIVCFNDKEIEKAKKFIENVDKTDMCLLNVQTIILDAKIKKSPSAKKGVSLKKYDKELDIIYEIYNVNNIKELKQYINDLKKTFNNLTTNKKKEEYVRRIMGLYYDNVNNVEEASGKLNLGEILGTEDCYKIENTDLKGYVINLLGLINNIKSVVEVLDDIAAVIEDMNDEKENEIITTKEIETIFAFIKKEYPVVYQYIGKLKIRIYLFDYTCEKVNSKCVPSKKFIIYSMLCTRMSTNKKVNDGTVNPIYVFFYLLGIIINWSMTKSYNKVVESFVKLNSIEDHSYEDRVNVFAGSFAMYVMNNTKYDKYSILKQIPEDIYDILNIYFDKLFKSFVESGNDLKYVE